MTTQRVHIRGNMGTQILQAAAALAVLDPNDEPIICVNTGGNLSYDARSHLEKVFDPKIRIIDSDEMRKTPYWKEGVATSIFTNREKILKWLPPTAQVRLAADVAHMYASNRNNALHIRGGDKKIASIRAYSYLAACAENATVYTDDQEFARKIAPVSVISKGSAIEDWMDMLISNNIFAAPSSFVMCMLLFNPEKNITFLGDKYNDGGYDVSADIMFLREAQQFCPNVVIIDD